MDATILLAMVHHSSWLESLFSNLFGSAFGLLCFAAIYTAVAFPFFAWRWFPFTFPYFSRLFVLALCPFLFTSVLLFIRADRFIADYDNGNLSEPLLQPLRNPIYFVRLGGAASLCAIALYSVLYVRSQNQARRNAQAQP